eukprot:8459662-Lingulodinium_polyedra.AAC.1
MKSTFANNAKHKRHGQLWEKAAITYNGEPGIAEVLWHGKPGITGAVAWAAWHYLQVAWVLWAWSLVRRLLHLQCGFGALYMG